MERRIFNVLPARNWKRVSLLMKRRLAEAMRNMPVFLTLLFLMSLAAPLAEPAEANASDGEAPLNVALILHQHQPYYRNVATDFYELPWVRVHAIHEYVDSPGILSQYPDTNVTYNIVPSLIEQLEDYADPETLDDHTQYAVMNWPVDDNGLPTGFPEDLTQRQKWDMQGEYFRIQPWVYGVEANDETYGWMANASAAFNRLFTAWQDDDRTIMDSNGSFMAQDMIDLATVFHLFQLSAPHVQGEFSDLETDGGAPHRNETIIGLFEQGAPYTVEDFRTVLDYQRSQMLNVMPMYAALAQRGQVELTTTPRYHPIMPLLAMDGWTMEDGLAVDKDAWIDDVEWQVDDGLDVFENATGLRPTGMWPSEQAVSQEVVAPMVNNGIRWAVSDEQVLGASTLEAGGNPNRFSLVELTQPYMVGSDEGEMAMFFRHQELSDRIGFAYGDMDPVDAVDDFIEGIEEFRNSIIEAGNDPAEHVLTVALDGENWLFMSGFGYTDNGRAFMHELFSRLSSTPTVHTTTPGAFLDAHGTEDLPRLSNLATGSWINGELARWAGEPEETLNWRRLVVARDALLEVEAAQPDHPGLAAARLALMAAEGSDWFWWYGADQDSGDDLGFDTLYKNHLKTIYQSLNLPLPPDLEALTYELSEPEPAATGMIEPLIDGLVFDGEWDAAAVHAAPQDGGALDVDRIVVGHDTNGIHLRIDAENARTFLDGTSSGGTPHLQLYLMEPNAVDTNVVGANYRSYYGASDLGFPARTMLWFDLGDADVDGKLPYNAFTALGEERWTMTDTSDTVIAINETIELSLTWSDLGLEPLDVTRLRLVVSEYQLRGQGRGADAELAPAHALEVQMPDLESWLTVFEISDAVGDETGDGNYVYPTAGDFAPGAGLFDITHVRLEQSAWNARFTFTMGEVTNGWGMMNGYSHANLQVYVDQGETTWGQTALFDGLRAQTDADWAWESAFMAIGEAAPTYVRQADSNTRFTTGIESQGNAETNQIVVTVSKDLIGGDLANYRYLMVVASQDGYGTGKVRQVDNVAAKWVAGGGAERGLNNQWYHSNIFDVVLPATANQSAMLGGYDTQAGTYASLSGVSVGAIPQQIYGLEISELSGEAALLTWSSSTGDVMTVTLSDGTVLGPEQRDGTSHRQLLTNLTPGTGYNVTVTAGEASSHLMFSTPAAADRTAPEILAVQASFTDEGLLAVEFYTTEPALGAVDVCEVVTEQQSCESVSLGPSTLRQVHRVELTLPDEGQRTVKVQVMDVAGNEAVYVVGAYGDAITPVVEPTSPTTEEGSDDDEGLPSPFTLVATLMMLVLVAQRRRS